MLNFQVGEQTNTPEDEMDDNEIRQWILDSETETIDDPDTEPVVRAVAIDLD